jgi:hypothetical protein
MVQLFLVLGLGYLAAKREVANQNFGTQLSRFILSITIPCLMIASTATMPADTDSQEILLMFEVSILFYLIMPFIAYLIVRLIGIKKEQRKLYMYMTIWSNVGFMGFPVIAAIFGESAIFYATIFNLIFNVSNFTLGIMLMSKDGKAALNLKNFLSPGIVASLLAVAMVAADIHLPAVLNSTVKMVGDTTTPLAMIVIGVSLAGISFKSVFTEIRLYPYLLIKQLLLPVLAYLLLKNFITNPYILGIAVIIIAMPVATSAVLFANRYDNDVALATKGVFITTLASVVTIPLITYLLMG